MSENEDHSSMRFMIMLGKFSEPLVTEFDECDEDNLMGFCSTLEEAKQSVATDEVFQEHGWHIIDSETGHIHLDDGTVITDPPKWNRHTGYEKPPKIL